MLSRGETASGKIKEESAHRAAAEERRAGPCSSVDLISITLLREIRTIINDQDLSSCHMAPAFKVLDYHSCCVHRLIFSFGSRSDVSF